MNNSTILTQTRFDVRLLKEQKEVIELAAKLSGFKSKSEFIVNILVKEASSIIVKHTQIIASENDQKPLQLYHKLHDPISFLPRNDNDRCPSPSIPSSEKKVAPWGSRNYGEAFCHVPLPPLSQYHHAVVLLAC